MGLKMIVNNHLTTKMIINTISTTIIAISILTTFCKILFNKNNEKDTTFLILVNIVATILIIYMVFFSIKIKNYYFLDALCVLYILAQFVIIIYLINKNNKNV